MTTSKSVLVVDDEALVRKMICAGVRAAFPAIVIETADCVAQAKERIQACIPSLLITDMMMGDGNGLEVITYLRNASPETRVPALIITGFQKEPDLQSKMDELKVDALVEKPFKIKALATLCASLLGTESTLFESTVPTASPVSATKDVAVATEADSACFDAKKALELVGFNRKLAANIAAMLLDETPGRLKEMQALQNAGDYEILQKKAHNLKGNAASFAAEELRQSAYALELAAKEESKEDSAAALLTLQNAFDDLKAILRDLKW